MYNIYKTLSIRIGQISVTLLLISLLAGCFINAQDLALPPGTQATNGDGSDIIVVDNKDAARPVYEGDFDPTEADQDIWQRIRGGFGMPDIATDTVTQKENWYKSRPNYFTQTGRRAERYIYYIVDEIEKRGMPMELALIPFLESAYDPEAVSHASAAGMWQFIPSTGQTFELQQDIFRDERRDVIASTNAALDYLQRLYNMFGDWHLALAAYNWGEGNVLKAINNNKRQNKPTDYLSLNMPKETRGYIPTLQALKNVVLTPDTFNIKLPLIENHPFFQTVAVKRDIDVALIIKLAEIPKEEFHALNAGINIPVVLAAATPQILLPWENAETFIANLNSYKGQLSTWTVWKTPSNMTVAQAANATKMPEKVLRDVNNIPAGMFIRQGSTLLVYKTQSVQGDVKLTHVTNATVEFAHSGRGRRSTPSKVAVSAEALAGNTNRTSRSTQMVLRNSSPSKVAVSN